MLTRNNQSKTSKEKHEDQKVSISNSSCLMDEEYQQEISEFCQRLSSLKLSDFLMQVQFNNGEVCCLSSRASLNIMQDDDTTSLTEKDITFRTERYSPECSFVFIATRRSDVATEAFFKKTWLDQFDNFCLDFIEKTKPIILNHYVDYKNAYIFNSVTYLTEVIKNKDASSPSLTTRERQCLLAAMDGLSTKETARKLGISHLTVRCYLEKVREKFNSSTIAEAVGRALFQGEIGRIFSKRSYETISG